jgi:hypothetical protein
MLIMAVVKSGKKTKAGKDIYVAAPKAAATPTKKTSSGGSSAPAAQTSAQTPFEKLAGERGVDLQAEQNRATSQLQIGQKVGGTTAQTQALQAQTGGKSISPDSLQPNSIYPSIDIQSMLNAASNPLGTQEGFTPASAGGKQNKAIEMLRNYFTAFAPETYIDPKTGEQMQNTATMILAPAGGVLGKKAAMAAARGGVGLFSKELPGLAKQTAGIDTGVAANTLNNNIIKSASVKLTTSIPWKTIAAAGIGILIVDKVLQLTLGGKNFGEFVGVEEASQTANIAARDAYISGNLKAYDAAAAARDEVLQNKTFWENIVSYVPYANLGTKLEDYRKAAVTNAAVYDQLAEDKRIQQTNNESTDDYWKRINEQETQQYKENVDYHTQAAKDLALYENKLIQAGQAAKRAEDKKYYIEQARFFAEQQDLERKKEEEDRMAISKFWIEYRKQMQEIQESSSPSHLTFGLL